METNPDTNGKLSLDPLLQAARRHGVEVGEWSARIGRELGLDAHRLSRLTLAAQLHDVGKVDVPRHILLKPGPLDAEEWRIVRRHPEAGARILSDPFFDDIRAFVLHHHERFDGGGYPCGLFGPAIPLEASIISVADSWCAMISDRPYRAAMSEERAREELARCSGSQFDPQCVDVLVVLTLSRSAPARPGERPRLRVVAPARLAA